MPNTRRDFLVKAAAATAGAALISVGLRPLVSPVDPNDRSIERLEFDGDYTSAFDPETCTLHLRTHQKGLMPYWRRLEGCMGDLAVDDVFRMREGAEEAPIAYEGTDSEIGIVLELPYKNPAGIWTVNVHPVNKVSVMLFQLDLARSELIASWVGDWSAEGLRTHLVVA